MKYYFSFLMFVLSCQVADLQKKIATAVARLKQQQNLYEAVRSDRNVYSKNLIETQVRLPTLFPLPFNVQLPRWKRVLVMREGSVGHPPLSGYLHFSACLSSGLRCDCLNQRTRRPSR